MPNMMDFNDPAVLAMWGATICLGLFVAMSVAHLFQNGERTSSSSSSSTLKKVLPLDDFQDFPLIRKEVLSHDTARFTLALPAGHVLGLPTGQHVTIQFADATDNGKMVQRSYTPVTDDTTVGEVGLVIKIYRPLAPKFPLGGKMSQYLDNLQIGDSIRMKGPKGHLTWKGNRSGGHFTVKPVGKPLEERCSNYIGMMAGGTGITPMLQVLNAIFTHPAQATDVHVKLIYANQTPDDILVREELEALAAKHADRFTLWYTVDNVKDEKDWKYSVGFINTTMVAEHLLFPQAKNGQGKRRMQFFMCGPPPMLKFACIPALQELGYTEKDWVAF